MGTNTMAIDTLCKPIRMGKLHLPNRLVMAR